MATVLTAAQLGKLAKLSHLQSLAARTKTVIDNLNGSVIKTVKVNGTALTAADNAVDVLITVAKRDEAVSGYAATYDVKANNVAVGDAINIPKDFLVKNANLQTCAAADTPIAGLAVGDPYLDFVINTKDVSYVKATGTFKEGVTYYSDTNGTVADTSTGYTVDETSVADLYVTTNDQHIYINVKSLVDIYTAGNGLNLSDGEFSVKISSSTANGLSVDANGVALALAAGASTTYVAATGTYVSGTTYYTDSTGATTVDTSEFVEGTTDVSSYYVAHGALAQNGAMSGADKAKLDGMEIAADADVATMLDEELPVSQDS